MLMLVIPSCRSNQIEYKTIFVYPTLDFPDFPKIKDSIHLDQNFHAVAPDDTESEIMWDVVPHWWYKEMTRFKVYYEATRAEYNAYIMQYQD